MNEIKYQQTYSKIANLRKSNVIKLADLKYDSRAFQVVVFKYLGFDSLAFNENKNQTQNESWMVKLELNASKADRNNLLFTKK